MSMKKDRAAHEIPIAYPDEQRALFLSPKGNLSIYPTWHRKGIQAKTGDFPSMVAKKLRLRGGDPDLFVYRDSGPSDYLRFFVEVKMPPDRTRASQMAVFQLYERYLAPVHVACVQSFSRWMVDRSAIAFTTKPFPR